MANSIIEKIRGKIPYIKRMHREIDKLRNRLAAIEEAPELKPAWDPIPKRSPGSFVHFFMI